MNEGEIVVRYQKEPPRIEFSADDELALLLLLMTVKDLTEDELAIIGCYREVKELGFGKMEVSLIDGSLETAWGTKAYKRKDFSKLIKGKLLTKFI